MPITTLRHHCYTQLDPESWCATAQINPSISLLLKPSSSSALVLSKTPIPCINSRASDLQTFDFRTFNLRTFDFYTFDFYTLYWQVYHPNSALSTREIAYNARQQQRNGVRLLLQNLLSKIGIIDTLDQSEFPYRLMNSRYYVCFSHSGDKHLNKVAVVVSTRCAVGIDIEVQEVAWRVAQRFYHANELAILAELASSKRDRVCRLLWQLKESFIKIYQYKLAQGLGIDYAALIPALSSITAQDERSSVIINDNKTNYQIAVLPYQQTVVIF
ncbi:4'-phosphopantetheinyl transferase [Psychrobacter sp. PL15]|uniref:4'-phosphopantetheinyl transferase family protein n=1 Tax=Psychrobacter sp. PL15 TaxID=3071719 RepID=UPI002DF75993|nr:4'-phosphopantetheinyl transferase [Psychrobacter sp. PL15]